MQHFATSLNGRILVHIVLATAHGRQSHPYTGLHNTNHTHTHTHTHTGHTRTHTHPEDKEEKTDCAHNARLE